MGAFDDNDLEYHLTRDGSVEQARPVEKIRQLGPHWQEFYQKSEKEPAIDEAGNHFEELQYAAATLDKRLTLAGSPYRFCVYMKDGEILVEMIKLDENEEVAEDSVQTITHDEFQKWITDFDSGEGLLFDKKG